MEEIYIGMNRTGMRKLADEINRQCDQTDNDGGIEVVLEAEFNGSGPSLRLTLSNDDMEREPALSPNTAYWER